MKTNLLCIIGFIFFITQIHAQLLIGDTFNDGTLSYKIENLSPEEVNVTGFSGATVANLVIPSTVSSSGQTFNVVGIGASAFKQKSGLVSVQFPTTLSFIGDTAFQQTATLESFTLTNPSALNTLGRAIFAGCTGLLSADFSDITVDLSSSDSMFNNCTSMAAFTMKNNTTTATLPPAFLGTCSALVTADLSGCTNIISLSDNVFRNNTSLTTLYLGTDTPPSLSFTTNAQTFAFVNNGSLTNIDRTLYVPTNTGASNYSAIPDWTNVFGSIQPQEVQEQITQRPMIWVKNSDKAFILNEINNNTWKSTYYTNFKNRVDAELSGYLANRQGYLSQLPFDNSNAVAGQIPPFKTITDGQANAGPDRNTYKLFLQSGIDSGVVYFLTGNEDYAKFSASIFYTYLKAMSQVPVSSSTNFNAGWIYPLDHLREARDFGAQLPILYDFIAGYIKGGGTAYDFAANNEVTINWWEAESVFKKYIYLAKERGGIASNWPALESASLACNILALDSETERNTEIQYVINKRANRQIPFSVMSQKIDDNEGIWPEPFTYSKYVAEYSTYLMALITKYDGSYDLASNYANLPQSLDLPNDFSYPNDNRTLHFGDGSRGFRKYTDGYEMAYYLGQLTNDNLLLDKFGKLINSSVNYDNYNRANFSSQRSTPADPYYNEPLRLLWFSGTIEGESTAFKQNITNKLGFAGISIQRNLETPDPVLNGLMLFVGGAGFVHSYASGMNMELYGPKTVIGAAAGNTRNYTSTIHRNYYRLFAAHNTVIVNGASQGSGGNANIDINTVQKLSIEPEYTQVPVSPKNSFSTTSFLDDRGSLAEALQYRTMAIVRTSPTSGYYVDVFKSNSSLSNEYHDYVYHNLSDILQLQSNGVDLSLTSDSNRYAAGNTVGGFDNPGWQYFTDVQTSGTYSDDVTATFTANRLGGLVNMKMLIPGEANREYTRVNAPPTVGIAGSYDNTPTPTVVIRHNGEAWNTPFAVVYEPYYGDNTNSVTKVTNIKRGGNFAGLEVLSTVEGKNMKQIILLRDNDDGIFNDLTLDVEFTGRFIVLSLDENEELTSIYMGKGSHVKYKGWDIDSQNGEATSFYVDILDNNATITTNSQLTYTYPVNTTITNTNVINNGTLAIEENNFNNIEKTFKGYQNKGSDTWTFETKNIEITNSSELKIVNLLGQTILSQKLKGVVTEVNLNHLSRGIYIALITNNNSVEASKKIILKP
ncbi:leucine-rich repeat protein [Gaetbulibacter sp. M240]|uniref:leucine-rich repeat protein n=1 Tax=Gaetbulibacter sp. M240 TaxID=3126511 RepID=UPI00374F17BD